MAFGLPESECHRLWIIDCITKTLVPVIADEDQVKYVGSPVDLTGMGNQVHEDPRRHPEGGSGTKRPLRHAESARMHHFSLKFSDLY